MIPWTKERAALLTQLSGTQTITSAGESAAGYIITVDFPLVNPGYQWLVHKGRAIVNSPAAITNVGILGFYLCPKALPALPPQALTAAQLNTLLQAMQRVDFSPTYGGSNGTPPWNATNIAGLTLNYYSEAVLEDLVIPESYFLRAFTICEGSGWGADYASVFLTAQILYAIENKEC